MAKPTFQFLRGASLYNSLAEAKSALQTKVASLHAGEPALVYYSGETGQNLALFGLGGSLSGSTTGTGLFYNTIEVDSAIAALGSQISGDTTDQITEKLTMYALKNYIEAQAASATTTVVSGNGISVTESINGTAKQFQIAANVSLEYVDAVTSGDDKHNAQIVLKDLSNSGHTFGTIDVANIIGNGILQSASYDANTGKLTLTFKTADGKTQDVVVDLGSLIDINDVAIKEDSKQYLAVELSAASGESGYSQAVFSAKVVAVSADTQGMADAKDVKTYVDSEVAKEKAAREAAIEALDADVSGSTTNITVGVQEGDGKVSGVTVDAKYATVSSTGHTGDVASAQTAAFSASDTTQIATGAHVQAAATYAKGLYDEALGYADAKVENLAGDKTSDDAASVTVQVKTDNGEVSDVIVSNVSAGVTTGGTGSESDPYYLSASTTTGGLVGADIATVKTYVDNMVNDAKGDLSVEAAGDSYVDAHVDASNNKKVVVSAQTATVAVSAGTAGVYDDEGAQTTAPEHGSLSGTPGKLLDASDAMSAAKTYVDGEIAIEAARSNANTLASIKALDTALLGETGKYVKWVKEDDGIVAVSADTVNASEIAYTTGSTDVHISAATTAEGALRALDAALKSDEDNTISYKLVKLDTPSSETIKEEFKLQQKTATASTWSDVSDSQNIKIYKDSSVVSIDFVESGSSQYIKYTYVDVSGTTQTTYVDISKVIIEGECASGVTTVDGKFVGKVDADTEKDTAETPTAFLTVGANGFKVSGIIAQITRQIDALNKTVSAETTYSTVTVEEEKGLLKSVAITNTIGVVSAGTAGYAEAVETKAYVDKMVSDKNVSATGDSYVAASAAGNKVTIATNVSALTVNQNGSDDTTISGTANTLVDGAEIAEKVTNFVNYRLDEEIKALDKAEETVSATNVSFEYSEADGIVTISGLSVDYATVNYTAHTGTASAQTSAFSVASGDETKLVKASDVEKAANYAKDLSTEDRAYTNALVATLDAEVTSAALEGTDLAAKVTEVDGKLTAVALTLSYFDAGEF